MSPMGHYTLSMEAIAHSVMEIVMDIQEQAIKSLARHLEFFGYTNEFFEEDPGFKADHEGYGKVFVRPMGRIVLHTNYWLISENASDEDAELLMIINRLNQSSYVSTYSVLKDGGLRIDAVFAGEYSKSSYGEFIDDFHQDIVRAIRNDEELRLYREQRRLASVN